MRIRDEVKNTALIVCGLLCCSAAYNLYLISNSVVAGGFTGIGQLLTTFLPVSVGMVNLILNIPLFIFSMKSLGVRFGFRSLAAMIGLSFAIDWIPFPVATSDVMLATIFGGIIGGIGFGLILRGSATTGGTDMLASLIHRICPVIKVSVGIFAVDALVIIASGFVFDQQAAMYSLISAFLMNLMVDMVLEGPNGANSYFIISDHSEEIAKKVMDELERGVTAFYGKGMYSNTEKQILLCVVNRFESMSIRRIVFSIDPNAFVIASKTHEVLGEGFKEQNR